jgi:hypothetical protein
MSFLEKSEDYRIQSKEGTWRSIDKYSDSPFSYEVEGVKFHIGNIGNKRILSKGPPFLPIIPAGSDSTSNVHIYLHVSSDSATVILYPYNILVRQDSGESPLKFSITESAKDKWSIAFDQDSATIQKGQWSEFGIQFKVPYDSLQYFSVDIGKVFINDHYAQIPIIEFRADPSKIYYPFTAH